MNIKSTADIRGLHPNFRYALPIADWLWKNNGHELTITSGTDGKHSAGSLHYSGRATDLRTKYFDQHTAAKIAVELQKRLGCLFKVIYENPGQVGEHIHVGYIGY